MWINGWETTSFEESFRDNSEGLIWPLVGIARVITTIILGTSTYEQIRIRLSVYRKNKEKNKSLNDQEYLKDVKA